MDRRSTWTPSQVGTELSQHSGIHRYADGLTLWLAGEPGHYRLIKLPCPVLLSILLHEPVKFQQREFSSCVAISQATFEKKKAL
jgi:hypothetical protein